MDVAASVAAFPIRGFARPGTCAPAAAVRTLVPASPHRRRPDLRPLREHVRTARRGAGRRAGADWQPPRAESGQDGRADRGCSGSPTAPRRGSSRTPQSAADDARSRRGESQATIGADSRTAWTSAAYPRAAAARPAIREVITVANLRAEKSHETLIAAAAALAPTPSVASLPDRRRRPAPLRAAGTRAGARAWRHRDRLPRAPRRRAGPAGRGRPVRAAVTIGSVSQTAPSKRWPRGCRSSRARSAACST